MVERTVMEEPVLHRKEPDNISWEYRFACLTWPYLNLYLDRSLFRCNNRKQRLRAARWTRHEPGKTHDTPMILSVRPCRPAIGTEDWGSAI